MTELRLYKSRGKALRLLLGSSAFVAVGIYLLGQPQTSRFMAGTCIAFFGLGVILGLYQLLDRRPQIIINEVGVFDRHAHHEFINWEIIQDVYTAKMNNQRFICLVVDEAFEPSRQRGWFRQKLASLNKGMGFQELNLWLGNVSIDAMRLAELILAMRGAERPERKMLVRKAIANL